MTIATVSLLRPAPATAVDLLNARARRTVGHEIATPPKAPKKEHTSEPSEQAAPSQAEALVRLGLGRYRLGRTTEGEPFAVERVGPSVARMFRGNRDSVRAILAREYRRAHGKTPTASALADALTVLEGEASDAEMQPVALRVARHGEDIVIDLGTADGTAVIVSPGCWYTVDRSPILFTRTALTGALPIPERGGSLADFRELLNCSDDVWSMLVGWAVAALTPDIPHPILAVGGEQGTGKTSAARMLVGITDPSPAPLRSEPRDVEAWAVAAAGSTVVALDNISSLSPWLSDALCKACTGDALIRRRLYSDSELTILRYRRCVILTSIDPGAVRGDLADRLVLADLQHIAPKRRRTESELTALYDERRPFIFGALLDLLAAALVELPKLALTELPRMADFARVLGAIDRAAPEITNGQALPAYLAQSGRLADDVLEGDPFGDRLRRMLDEGPGSWCGTSAELHRLLTPEHPPRKWPQTARAASGCLRRLVPAFRMVGWMIDIPTTRTNHGRVITIERSTVADVDADEAPAFVGTVESDADEGELI